MPTRTARYESMDRGELDPIAVSEVYTVEWQVRIPPTAPWAENTPAAPTTTFDLNGVTYRAQTLVGGNLVNATTGSVLVELLVGGSVVSFLDVPFNDITGAGILVQTPLWPAYEAAPSVGASVSVRITNNTDVPIAFDDEQFEQTPYVEAEESYVVEVPIPEVVLCDGVYVCTAASEIKYFLSSDQTLQGTYSTIGVPHRLSFDSLHNFYVTETDAPNTRTIIEKFDEDGVSLGVFGPDLVALGIHTSHPMGICVARSRINLVAYKTDETLWLFRIDSGGSLIDSYELAHDAPGGNELDVDVDQYGRVYYIEELAYDALFLRSRFRSFAPSTSTQSTILTFEPVEGTPTVLASFRLLYGAQGGAVLSVFYLDTVMVGRLATYDKDVNEGDETPLTEDTIGEFADATGLCFGEMQPKVWVGRNDDNLLDEYDIDANTPENLTIDPSGSHYGIANCTALRGKGFFPPTSRRHHAFTAVIG